MAATFTATPRPLAALLRRLEDLEVTLPDRLAEAATLLEDAANGALAQEVTEPAAVDLTTLSRAEVVDLIRSRATMRAVRGDVQNTTWLVALQIAERAAELVRDNADDIIGQLRPRFDDAADALHAASRSGLTPGMTPAAVLALGNPEAMAAWNGLAPHLRILDEIAAARIAMTDEADVAPSPDSFGPRQYGACFDDEAALWQRQDGASESSADKWLRLCAHKPARLLDTATTEAAARKWRVTPRPIVDFDVNGTPAEMEALRQRSVYAWG